MGAKKFAPSLEPYLGFVGYRWRKYIDPRILRNARKHSQPLQYVQILCRHQGRRTQKPTTNPNNRTPQRQANTRQV